MRTIKEYIFDKKLENYLFEQLLSQLKYRKIMQYHIFGIDENIINENLGNFINWVKVVNKISNYITQNIEIEDVIDNKLKDKIYNIDVSDCDSYCDKINLKIRRCNAKYYGGNTTNVNDKIIDIGIDLNPYFITNIEEIEGIILHELIHGYEEYNRKINGKTSLFSELSEEYYTAKEKIAIENYEVRILAIMKYLFNPKERNANFGTLEKDIKNIINNIDPKENSKENINKIKEELKKSSIWKSYFDFGKFVLELNHYTDKQLEKNYYLAVTSEEDINKDIEDNIKGLKNKNYKFVKSAKEIRKEAKIVWEKFISKFNTLFCKIYCNYVLKEHKTEFGFSQYETMTILDHLQYINENFDSYEDYRKNKRRHKLL